MNNNSTLNTPALILGGLLAMGAIGGSLILGKAAQSVAESRESISVKGVAEKAVRADRAQWKVTLSSQANSVADALPILQQDTQRVVKALSNGSLTANENLEVSEWSSEPLYQKLDNGSEGGIVGYRLSRTLGVVLNDVQKPARLNATMEALIGQGLDLHDNTTQYLVGNLDQIKLQLIGEATKNAHDRAVEFAKSGGVSVGAMRSASQGVFQIRAPLSTDESDYSGDYDTSTIDKVARVVVTADYAIQNR